MYDSCKTQGKSKIIGITPVSQRQTGCHPIKHHSVERVSTKETTPLFSIHNKDRTRTNLLIPRNRDIWFVDTWKFYEDFKTVRLLEGLV